LHGVTKQYLADMGRARWGAGGGRGKIVSD
jgi:hypothetical protein